MEVVNDNISTFMHWTMKTNCLMAKVNFLSQAESFMAESDISQLCGNAYNKTRKGRYFN